MKELKDENCPERKKNKNKKTNRGVALYDSLFVQKTEIALLSSDFDVIN